VEHSAADYFFSAFVFGLLAVFCLWLVRRSPRYLPWKRGGAERALRYERALVTVLLAGAALLTLVFVIAGFGAL
jgi:hypothetical protein